MGARQAAEHLLAEERAMWRTLADNLPSAIYAKDKASHFLYANPATIRTMCKDLPNKEIVGKTDFDFFEREAAERFIAEEREIMRTGQAMIRQERNYYDEAEGRWQWVQTSKLPFRG